MESRKAVAVHLLILLLLGCAVYANSLHVPFVFDDESSIVHNPVIRNLDNFLSDSSGYRFNPRRFVAYLTLALNYRLGGLDVTGYHLVNIVVHLVNGLLVYAFLRLTFRTPLMSGSSLSRTSGSIGLLAASLFVVHPLQTEAVTYVVQRMTSLAAMWSLLSICLYARARLIGESGDASPRNWMPWYALSLISVVLAMRTKEFSFTLPVVIALYEWTFFERPLRNRLAWIAPILATLPIIPLGLLDVHKPLGEILSDVGGATRLQSDIPRWDYLITEFRVIATYVRLLFVPVNQNVDYDYPIYRSLLSPQVLASFVFLGGLFAAALYSLSRSRKRRDGGLALVAFGIFWFFIALSLESSVVPIADVIFEHRMYVPSIGALIAVVGCGGIVSAARLGPKGRKALFSLGLAVVALYSAMTYRRNIVWASNVTLWSDAARKSPGKARVFDSLGSALFYEGRMEEAIRELKIATHLQPGYAHAHYNLGIVYGKLGRIDDAIDEFQTAVRLRKDYVEAVNVLGLSFEKKGFLDKAVGQYLAALSLDPAYADAHKNLGNVYMKMDLIDKAIESYGRAAALRPEDGSVHNNLGIAFVRKGHIEQGLFHFQAAVRTDPRNPVYRRNRDAAYQKLVR